MQIFVLLFNYKFIDKLPSITKKVQVFFWSLVNGDRILIPPKSGTYIVYSIGISLLGCLACCFFKYILCLTFYYFISLLLHPRCWPFSLFSWNITLQSTPPSWLLAFYKRDHTISSNVVQFYL